MGNNSGACRAALAKRLLSTCTTRRRSASTRGSPVGRSTRTCVLGFAAPGSSSPPARALGRRNPRVRTPDPAAGDARLTDGLYTRGDAARSRAPRRPSPGASSTRASTLPRRCLAAFRPCTARRAPKRPQVIAKQEFAPLSGHVRLGITLSRSSASAGSVSVGPVQSGFSSSASSGFGNSSSSRLSPSRSDSSAARSFSIWPGGYVREDRVAHDLPQGGGGKRIEFDAWPAVRP